MKHSVLVVGLGQIGMGYDLNLDTGYGYTHARAFSQHPEFELIGGVEPDPEKRSLFKSRYRCQAHTDLEAALGLHKPQIVVVATPTSTHGKTITQILSYSKPTAILCEKPLTDNLPEAKALVDLCIENSVQLFVNYVRRSDPGIIEVKRRIKLKEIAVPAKGVVWYTKGFRHNCSHFINLLECWLGPVKEHKIIKAESIDNDSDFQIDACISFDKGEIVFLSGWDSQFTCHTLELLCQNGRLLYGTGFEHINWQPTRAHQTIERYTVLSEQAEVITTGKDKYQLQVVDQLASALRGDKADICQAQEALETLSSIEKIFEAIK